MILLSSLPRTSGSGQQLGRCTFGVEYAFITLCTPLLVIDDIRCLFALQREIIGSAAVEAGTNVWTYRYNQPNPTQNEPGITEHAAENWMMFRGTNTG